MRTLFRRPRNGAEWQNLARQLLKVHMTLRGWRFADLARGLAAIGVEQSEVNLRNRIPQGRFSAVLFLQCLTAMGVEELELPRAVDREAIGAGQSDEAR